METLRSIQNCIQEWNESDSKWQSRMPVQYEHDALVDRKFRQDGVHPASSLFDHEREIHEHEMLMQEHRHAAGRSEQRHTGSRLSEDILADSLASFHNSSSGARVGSNFKGRESFAERTRRIASRAEAIARAKHASAVSSGSPYVRGLALQRKSLELRESMHQQLQQFQMESERASFRNSMIRQGLSRQAEELDHQRFMDHVQLVEGIEGEEEAEKLRIDLEKEKQKFLGNMIDELGPHEAKVRS